MSDMIGQQLGQYTIVEEIPTTAHTAMYKAHQPSLNRDVAIKVLSGVYTQDQSFVERFEKQARAIAGLVHPNIAPPIDYGVGEQGPYLVMQYFERGTLADCMDGGPMSLDEMTPMMVQIGSALDYAHQRGVIHANIKPSNIMVDAGDNAYLSDFWLDPILDDGGIVGTPAYMAPEQTREENPVDHRIDIYSLGVVLFEVLSGQLPYTADTPVNLMLEILNTATPSVRAINPAIPEAVEQVIYKALAKDPDERYQSGAELAADLQQAVGNGATAATRGKLPPRYLFISYRRFDSATAAGRIYDKLLTHYPEDKVFKDIDNIPIGQDFRQIIDDAVGQCRILLAVMGRDWVSVTGEDGQRRLHNPADFVRIEVEAALRRGIPVIPVLVRGAQMPKESDLPDSLKELVYRNGMEVRPDPDFHRDMDRLIVHLDKLLGE